MHGGGLLLGLPSWRGWALMGSSWLAPSTPCPQAWQLSGGPGDWVSPSAASVCGLTPSVPRGTGPRFALTCPCATPPKVPAAPNRGHHPPKVPITPQGCLSPPMVPAAPKGSCHLQRCRLPPKVPVAPGNARSPPEGLELGDTSASPSCPLELLPPGGLKPYNFSFFLLKTNNLFLIK